VDLRAGSRVYAADVVAVGELSFVEGHFGAKQVDQGFGVSAAFFERSGGEP